MSYDPIYGGENETPEQNRENYVESRVVGPTESTGARENTENTSATGSASTGNTGAGRYSAGGYAGAQQSTAYNYDMYTGQPLNQNSNSAPKKKEKKSGSFAASLGKAAAIALVFGLVSGGVFTGTTMMTNKLVGKTTTEQSASQSSNGTTLQQKTDGTIGSTTTTVAKTLTDVSEIVENAMPSIVQVTNMSVVEYQNWFGQHIQYPQKSAGSGVIIDQDDKYLYIATNNHVVSNSNSLTVTFNDESAVPAEIQGTQADTDVAVVKVEIAQLSKETLAAIKVATIGSSDSLKVGAPAIVIGNALGYGQSTTQGIISALDREVTIQNEETGESYTNKLIQTDAAVNPGNSGGALLNMNGELVGIVSAKYADETVEGMGYAIPISQASNIIEKLMDKESTDDSGVTAVIGTAYLGVAGVDIDETLAAQYNMPVGIYISTVKEGSAAEAAGIQQGDVITAVDGEDISSFEKLYNYIAEKKPGDTMKISLAKVQNNFEPVEIEVTLGERPSTEG